MAKLALNKSSLNHESASLQIYRKFLPSLDMKRKELLVERAKALNVLKQTQTGIADCQQSILDELPMLSNRSVDLNKLVTVKAVEFEQQKIMGASLPVLKSVDINIRHYSFLAKPHWVDAVVNKLKHMLILKIRVQVEERRLALLEQAVQKITQRVNLFDKVLIPRTEQNLKTIQIYLSDVERASVVRAKLAKRKRLQNVDR